MKTRLTQGLATVAVFGALVLGVAGGAGSVGAASTGFESHASIAASGHQALLPAGFGHAGIATDGLVPDGGVVDLRQDGQGTVVIELPGVATGQLPLTKGGRFP